MKAKSGGFTSLRGITELRCSVAVQRNRAILKSNQLASENLANYCWHCASQCRQMQGHLGKLGCLGKGWPSRKGAGPTHWRGRGRQPKRAHYGEGISLAQLSYLTMPKMLRLCSPVCISSFTQRLCSLHVTKSHSEERTHPDHQNALPQTLVFGVVRCFPGSRSPRGPKTQMAHVGNFWHLKA